MNTHDIFGLAFKDYLSGDREGRIVVKTVFPGFTEVDELPVSYFFRCYDLMPEWEQLALSMCNGVVLDSGAGAGAHAIELQKRGLDVYAIDISEGAVQTMRERGVNRAFCIDFMDVTTRKFNTILFLMNGVGMARSLPGLKRLLTHARSLLVPGGVVLLESTNVLYMYKETDGSLCVPMGDKYYGEIDYQLTYKNHNGAPFPWLFVDMDNLTGIAESCGFGIKMLYEGETDNYLAALQVR